MSDWLRDRLTPAKQKIARWSELAEILEKLWEEFYDPELSRTQRMRSSYTADDRDLVKKIREMGDYFSFEFPKESDRPIALAWRRLEIEYKDVELILQSVLRRHFGDFPVSWYPLFAPINEPYGSRYLISDYLTEDEYTKNISPDGYFLTSRGYLGVDKLGLMRDGLTKEIFRNEARPLVLRTKPLHIIFEGFLWYLRYDLGVFDPEIGATWNAEDFYELQFGPLGTRYDYLPADVRHTDIDIFDTRSETDRRIGFNFYGFNTHPWRLDLYLRDGFGDLVPLDVTIYETKEHRPIRPFNLIFREQFRNSIIPNTPVTGEIKKRELERLFDELKDKQRLDSIHVQSRKFDAIFDTVYKCRLDDFYKDGFGDLLPIDVMVQKALELEIIRPFNLIFHEQFRNVSILNTPITWKIEQRELERQWERIYDEHRIEPFHIQSHKFDVIFNAVRKYKLDDFYMDGFGDLLPIDLMSQNALEHNYIQPFNIVFSENIKNNIILNTLIKYKIKKREIYKLSNELNDERSVDLFHTQSQQFDIIFNSTNYRKIDYFYKDGFGDTIPLDIALLETREYISKSNFNIIFREQLKNIIINHISVIRNIKKSEIERKFDKIKNEQKINSIFSQTRKFNIIFDIFNKDRLDDFYKDGFGDLLPIDLTYNEKNIKNIIKPIYITYNENQRNVKIEIKSKINILQEERSDINTVVMLQSSMSQIKETERVKSEKSLFFGEDEISLDIIPKFDEIHGDFTPLDYPYGGFV